MTTAVRRVTLVSGVQRYLTRVNLAAAPVSYAAPSQPTGSPPGTWSPIFEDSFGSGTLAADGVTLRPDTAKWRWNRSGGSTADAPASTATEGAAYDPAQVALINRQMRLTLAAKSTTVGGKTYPWVTGTASTEGRFTFPDGAFVEARVRLPLGAGLWPRLYSGVSGAAVPEIDMLEVFDTAVQSRPSLSYRPAPSGLVGPAAYGASAVDYRSTGHVFGLHRVGQVITPWIDGVAYTNAATPNIDTSAHFVVLSLACYASAGASAPLGAHMDVDYLKVWQFSPPVPLLSTAAGELISAGAGVLATK